MKRDWDTIRDVLIEVEALGNARHENIQYGPASESDETQKDAHGVLLCRRFGFSSKHQTGTL